jgi:ubiquitin-activating enzyme E1 C
MLNKPTAFPICTIANTPRLPEHCIEWASVLEWPRVHGGNDLENPYVIFIVANLQY